MPRTVGWTPWQTSIFTIINRHCGRVQTMLGDTAIISVILVTQPNNGIGVYYICTIYFILYIGTQYRYKISRLTSWWKLLIKLLLHCIYIYKIQFNIRFYITFLNKSRYWIIRSHTDFVCRTWLKIYWSSLFVCSILGSSASMFCAIISGTYC